MLETIAIVLIVLWLLGLVSSYTMGGFIHVNQLVRFYAAGAGTFLFSINGTTVESY